MIFVRSPRLHAVTPFGSRLIESDRRLVQTLIEGGVLRKNENFLAAEPAVIFISGPFVVWSLEHGATRHLEYPVEFKRPGRIIYRTSGQPVVVLTPDTQPEEILPILDAQIRVETARGVFSPADGWIWHFRPPGRRRATHPSRASISGRPVWISATSPEGLDNWRFKDHRDRPVRVPMRAVLVLADGRRFLKNQAGRFEAVPPLGVGRLLAATASDQGAQRALERIHNLMDDLTLDSSFPKPRDIATGPCQSVQMVDTPDQALTAIECTMDPERHRRRVLVIDEDRRALVFPSDCSSQLQVSDGRYLMRRGDHWWIRTGTND